MTHVYTIVEFGQVAMHLIYSLLCHNCHFRGQISIAINEINGNGSVYYAINKANDLIIHCWNLNVLML